MRGLYATDASLYQIEPLGVVVPRTVDDVVATVSIAAEERVPIVPRGAATSLSGQTIGPAIIIDFSKYLNRIGIVDRDAMTVRVEPGVVLDQLNAHLKPLGLMFGPDVSTSDRATIGGMIGNNSAGARSLRYGKTVDHVRVGRRRPGRRHDGDAWARLPAEELERDLRARRLGRRDSSRGPRHGGRARAGDPRAVSRRSCGGSAATTSTSSCRACRFGRRAGATSPGSSTWRS